MESSPKISRQKPTECVKKILKKILIE